MKNNLSKYYLGAIALLFSIKAGAQLTISGPTCVVAGTIYQYAVSGNIDSSTTMQLCITAGIILDSVNGNTTCTTSGPPINKVLVIWNDSAADIGALNLISSSGNASISVHFTQMLQPGSIDSSVKMQIIGLNVVPASITCGPDSGGSCSPTYSYQWQQSADQVSWTDVPSAKGLALSLDSPLAQSTYYRRKVTETGSGSIDYSDVASVFVLVQVQGDSTVKTDSATKGLSGQINRTSKSGLSDQWTKYSDENSQAQSIWLRKPSYELVGYIRKMTKGKA
jgi:hypothetical protein